MVSGTEAAQIEQAQVDKAKAALQTYRKIAGDPVVRRAEARLAEANRHFAAAKDEVAEVDQQLANVRDSVASSVRSVVSGETSAEHFWRCFCVDAVKSTSWAATQQEWVRAGFAKIQSLTTSISELAHSLEEDGCQVLGVDELGPALLRAQELEAHIMERWPLNWAELKYVFPLDVEEVVYVPPHGFLRSMFTVAWNALRHPLTPTTIDLSTGKVLQLADLAQPE